MVRSRSPKVGSVSNLAIIMTAGASQTRLGAKLGNQAYDLGPLDRIIGQ